MPDFTKKSPRTLYSSTISEFLKIPELELLGILCDNYHGNTLTTTREAWRQEISILKAILKPWDDGDSKILFEYDIPRLGKRIDVVLIIKGLILCLEFKVGQSSVLQSDIEQVMDYALDLKNFHLYSHDRTIIPILIPTEYQRSTTEFKPSMYEDYILNTVITGSHDLQGMIAKVVEMYGRSDYTSVLEHWEISPYSPTPTIIEAARALYTNHSVEDITRHEADSVSTDDTISFILEVIKDSRINSQKSICFVTGVPGAGKTLVGLDVAVKQTYSEDSSNTHAGAVYLSGNGPLVAVLTEALARDNVMKQRDKGFKKYISESRREVSEFIQVIHRYRDNMLAKIKIPIVNGILEIDPSKAVKQSHAGYGEVEHVAIFDEAQRSWTHKRISDYLKRGGTYGNKIKVADFPMSEAEFLIWSMDQREDWAVIVCLVGGGQEINTGEAGIAEWINALNSKFRHWNVYISPNLIQKEYANGSIDKMLEGNNRVVYSPKLHLSVSLRSFRAETLSDFIHAMLNFDSEARRFYQEIKEKGYPLLLTRSIETARKWLREKSRGSQKSGVLVTKTAARFKPLAVNVLPSGDINAIHWFLEDKMDIRSSDYLEEAATEIQVQGLELDYACVLWDADMRCAHGRTWQFYNFNGHNKWVKERNTEQQLYMLNAYRVLMTRARMGMIICIPEGNSTINDSGFPEDPTRLPEFYDETYSYFKSLGIEEI